LLGLSWSGRTFDADGKIDLSGFTDKDLAASVKGTLHFEWRHGVNGGSERRIWITGRRRSSGAGRFDRWTADAEIANGTITLKEE
jgi:hypothetical protein